MKILLTGGSGMVGQNILEKSVDFPELTFLSPTSSELNLKDYRQIIAYLKAENPDMIIHCAGKVGGIQANLREPVNFLVDNLDMGRNLVMAAKEVGVARLLNLGSSCMYPRGHKEALVEELILKGELEPTNEGYALAKVMTARLCEYISREDSSLQYKTAIPCNLYGRWDKFAPEHSHLISAIINKMYEAVKNGVSEVEIWGDGLAYREFMYAEDLADFIFHCISNFADMPQNLNVGLGTDYTVNEYYQVVAEVMGFKGSFIHNLSKPVGMRRKLVDVSRLREFGWQHKHSLKEGIGKAIAFYKEGRK